MASTQLDVETGRGKAGEEHKSGIGHLGEEHFGEGELGPEMIQHARLERGLKARHVQFIAIGGSVGTGLFLGIGSALTKAGPLSLLLGYTFTGVAIYAMLQSLGEMATWLPLPGAIPQFCARYVDGALGFAVGWNTWYQAAITLCAELSAASIVIAYWHGADEINVAVWISILLILVIGLNIFMVSIYGEAEFIFASIKVLTIVGLLIMTFIVMLGGNPQHRRLGFTYWVDPGPMKAYLVPGATGRFLGFFSTLTNASFSFGGVEMVAVAAGEAENPRRNIPKAVKRVFWRILLFYVLGSLAVGILVASNDGRLLSAQASNAPGAAQSPWVIGIQNVGIEVLPSIINAVILTSASSAANAFVYSGSRYLYALAQNGQAPRVFLRCSKKGVPYFAVLATGAFGVLTYLSVQKNGGAAQAFQWFQNLVTISSLFTWASVCLAYTRFHSALKANGIDRDSLALKSPGQPYTAYSALVFFCVIIVFNGFKVFIHGQWDVADFVSAYVNIPIFFSLYIFWKLFKKTKFVSPEEADITTGKAEIDAQEDAWEDPKPRNALEKFWFWLA
ncbi:amino acid permease/ SLC12A domain-containing protein [Fusarium solani]|uniref:Amino acid permease/ SLC12A domain-containing protein n=1 Tax=Fusarium solani TaxID=169388 RepID=A0A9P9KUW0_FUSSL|nr:amino acid permease/ SLC12A domain-containing protein [Fusarium solani]KAH7268818.1 amino acid permease/ SLC12A domain-containing protein [Fusarium solani]